jgi:hypothetical protein
MDDAMPACLHNVATDLSMLFAMMFVSPLPALRLCGAVLATIVSGLAVANLALPGSAHAQERIYRCGNEYTNTLPPGNRSHCKPIEGGAVTVIPAPPKQVALAKPAEPVAETRGRDIEARQILEAELRKTRSKRDELLEAYNHGEPEKLGSESRNHQKYLDRVAAMKSSLDRLEQDIVGINRELSRLPNR